MSETSERDVVASLVGNIRDRQERLWNYLRRNPSATLASGEAALLQAEIDRLRDDLRMQGDWEAGAKAKIDRLNADLALDRVEIGRLNAAIDRVRALHKRVDSATWSNNCCDCCLVDFPCPTLRALDGDA